MNEEYLSEHPELLAGSALLGVTWEWLDEAYDAIFKARRNAWRIKTPLLLLEAADDHYTTSEGHQKFADNLRAGVLEDYVIFDTSTYGEFDAYHEILCEVDEIRNKAVSRIKTFIESFE